METRGLTPEEFTKNITKEATKNPNYTGYDSGDLLFDIMNSYHRDALENVLQGVLDNLPVDGVQMVPVAGSGEVYNIVISGVKVGTYEQLDDGYNTEFDVKPAKLSELVSKNTALNQRIQEIFQEG